MTFYEDDMLPFVLRSLGLLWIHRSKNVIIGKPSILTIGEGGGVRGDAAQPRQGDGADAVRHRDREQVQGGSHAYAQEAGDGHQRAGVRSEPCQSRQRRAAEERPAVSGNS